MNTVVRVRLVSCCFGPWSKNILGERVFGRLHCNFFVDTGQESGVSTFRLASAVNVNHSPPHRIAIYLPFPSSVRITPFFLFLSGLSADSTSFSRLIPLPGLEVSARHRGKESPDAKMATYSKFTFERLQISQSRNAIYASFGVWRPSVQ